METKLVLSIPMDYDYRGVIAQVETYLNLPLVKERALAKDISVGFNISVLLFDNESPYRILVRANFVPYKEIWRLKDSWPCRMPEECECRTIVEAIERMTEWYPRTSVGYCIH